MLRVGDGVAGAFLNDVPAFLLHSQIPAEVGAFVGGVAVLPGAAVVNRQIMWRTLVALYGVWGYESEGMTDLQICDLRGQGLAAPGTPDNPTKLRQIVRPESATYCDH